MPLKIALAGNPNSGKTTLFNVLTGSNQFVGNWPGVTVEKKEGRLRHEKEITITDLPGIYSLSPYTLEEVITRQYLLEEHPDVILNIVDASNLERNLFLTTQLLELGIPVVVALNMMDVVEKNGDVIDTAALSKLLGCSVVTISALKSKGISALIQTIKEDGTARSVTPPHRFDDTVEQALEQIAAHLPPTVKASQARFYTIKLFERDSKLPSSFEPVLRACEPIIESVETALDDDAESIITAGRYLFLTSEIARCYRKKTQKKHSTSDKIDRIVTNRFAALPIFAVIMFLVYFISVTTVGTFVTDWTNDGLFGEGFHLFGIGAGEYETAVEAFEADPTLEEPSASDYGIWVNGIPVLLENGLDAINTAPWLKDLILNGIVAGVGAVLGFVPQMLVLFFLLAFLESCGYMARIAFILDRIFRKFGLSGKSFIPMLIGTGCGVPGIMASRTIENERDRKMTIMTTTFIPCSAKLPIIAMIAGALFGGAWWVAPSAYFVGIAAIITSGILLKKTKLFSGDPAPFVMELPAYHWPTVRNILSSMWERGWSFIKKAGTVILLSSIFIWFTSTYGIENGQFAAVSENSNSFIAMIGSVFAWIFAPLGFGTWQSAVAAINGLVAKENVVNTFGILYGFAEVAEDGAEFWSRLAADFTVVSAYAFLVFNLLCAPCFAAIGAIKREMNSAKWTFIAIGYQTIFAYAVALCINQIGSLILFGTFSVFTVVAFLIVAAFLWLLLRPAKQSERVRLKGASNA